MMNNSLLQQFIPTFKHRLHWYGHIYCCSMKLHGQNPPISRGICTFGNFVWGWKRPKANFAHVDHMNLQRWPTWKLICLKVTSVWAVVFTSLHYWQLKMDFVCRLHFNEISLMWQQYKKRHKCTLLMWRKMYLYWFFTGILPVFWICCVLGLNEMPINIIHFSMDFFIFYDT